MELKQRLAAFVQLGKFLGEFAKKQEWQGYEKGVSKSDFDAFNSLIERVHIYNGWFTEDQVRKSLGEWSAALTEENLEKWVKMYPSLSQTKGGSAVAIIMAGNIPLVGFHDLLTVLLSGNKAIVKLSSDDDKLLPFIIDYFVAHIAPDMEPIISYASGKLENFQAIIATGSDNSSRYFEHYFSKYPHIIRKGRTSVAVLSGEESREELQLLGHDIFDYYGLGCRNVSKLFVPRDFDLDRFFGGIFPFSEVINHKKYANNYDYHKAIMMMNSDQLLENGFLLVKEDTALASPLGVLYVQRYDSPAEVELELEKNAEKIQCVVARNRIPFGQSQSPELWDYADGVDTMQFLINLG